MKCQILLAVTQFKNAAVEKHDCKDFEKKTNSLSNINSLHCGEARLDCMYFTSINCVIDKVNVTKNVPSEQFATY